VSTHEKLGGDEMMRLTVQGSMEEEFQIFHTILTGDVSSDMYALYIKNQYCLVI